MNNYRTNSRYQLGTTDKLFGAHEMDIRQAAVIKQTYMLLSLSVAMAMLGGYISANTPAIRGLFTGFFGWIVALVVLNALPAVAMAMRHKGMLGVIALLADGFVAGLILGPILWIASLYAGPDIIVTAGLITAIVFAAVTGYVMTTKRRFRAGRGIFVGIFFSLIGVMLLNFFMQLSFLSILIALGIGVLGVVILVYATSEVLHNPEADSPIPGALMLFSGLFNVFVATLQLLMAFGGRD